MKTNGNSKPGVTGIETQALIKKLKSSEKGEKGEIITYEELKETIGMSVRSGNNGYNYLRTATIILERDYGIVFKTIKNQGLKRIIEFEEFEEIGDKTIKHNRKKNMRAYRQLMCADREKMDQNQRVILDSQLTIVSLNTQINKKPTYKKIENKVNEVHEKLNYRKVLEIL